MSDQRRQTGQRGEVIARTYLQRKGYGIIGANWRCRFGEIDLIATDGPQLVFVEVRTRRSTAPGIAEESVTPNKQRRLVMLAHVYLQNLEEENRPWHGAWRIDVLAVQFTGTGRAQIHHLQSAVEAND
jgi:putative endonuclease